MGNKSVSEKSAIRSGCERGKKNVAASKYAKSENGARIEAAVLDRVAIEAFQRKMTWAGVPVSSGTGGGKRMWNCGLRMKRPAKEESRDIEGDSAMVEDGGIAGEAQRVEDEEEEEAAGYGRMSAKENADRGAGGGAQ